MDLSWCLFLFVLREKLLWPLVNLQRCVQQYPSGSSFAKATLFFIWFILSSCPCLSRNVFISSSCLICYPRIIFVFVIWQIVANSWLAWLWSKIAAKSMLSKTGDMSLVRTTALALWYPVRPALSFWVVLSSWNLYTKNLNPIQVYLFEGFSLHFLQVCT